MSPNPSPPDKPRPEVKILDLAEDYAFGKLFRVIRATLRYRRFDGQMSAPLTRINFERGDSVGVLLYDPRDDAVVLVRQFRYPVYASLAPPEVEGDACWQAWPLEIVAGVQEAGRTVQEVAHQELLEEAGYQIRDGLQPITTIFPSPGGSSERITLFLGEVDRHQRVAAGGGVAAQGEDIQVVVLPFREAMDRIARGEIRDAKTIIALQHLALVKAGSLPAEAQRGYGVQRKTPTLIIVTGLPCTGKTTLARRIAADFSLPLLSKDPIKERIFDGLGWSDREWSRRVSATTHTVMYDLLEELLGAGVSSIVESNFEASSATPHFLALQRRCPFNPLQIVCVTQGEVLFERYRRRSESGQRHPGHVDTTTYDEFRETLLQGEYEPLGLGGSLLTVDTTDRSNMDYDSLRETIRSQLA